MRGSATRPMRFLQPVLSAVQFHDRLILLGLFLLFTILRMPAIAIDGRFWAEEGKLFYVHAATTPWLQAVFFSYAGYMNLGANMAAVAARHFVSFDDAPRVTFVFALLAQICPAILLVTSNAPWLRSRVSLAAALLILVAAPSAEEVWLNSLHSQFQLALCAALILALDIQPGIREIFRRALLFLGPLYGMVAIVVLPLFILRAVIDRSRARLIQALILASGSAIQLSLFYQVFPGRQHFDFKLILGTFFAKNVVLPFLGFDASAPIISWLHTALDQGYLPIAVAVVVLLTVLTLLLLMFRAQAASWWLGLAFGMIAAISYYGALNASPAQVEPHLGGRYAFVPQVLFAWALIVVATSGHGLRNWIGSALVVWLIVTGVGCYLHPGSSFSAEPNWREEAAKWHRDPAYSPLIWPGGWLIPMPLPPA
ncbi:MAG: hypothetical protein P4M00_15505 [Azospirillaceae bacterium]|nr:hypothetical protein [Azospirillaceae bacterium]